MKIAVVNNYYYLRGGSERVLFGDQASLRDMGHEVLPYSANDSRNEPAATTDSFCTVADAQQQKGVARKFRAAKNLIYSKEVRASFAEFLLRYKPDVVHCHNIYGRLTTAVLDAAHEQNIPTLLTAHDYKLSCPSYLGLRQGKPCQSCVDGGYWRCVRWKCHKGSRIASLIYAAEAYSNLWRGKYDTVARILCPSRFLREVILASGVSAKRAVYHANALPLEQYAAQYQAGEYVLYVGRLSKEKGLNTLLKAERQMRLPMRIVGVGPMQESIARQIAAENLPVQLEGHQSGDRLRELYQGAAFVVVPSEWYENASMTLLEALAYGKPVLATAIGGNVEHVKIGQTGQLYPVGDADALATTATQLWSKKHELTQMGIRARQYVEEKHCQKKRSEELIDLYQTVIDEARQGATK